jgi:hypothetical protein
LGGDIQTLVQQAADAEAAANEWEAVSLDNF